MIIINVIRIIPTSLFDMYMIPERAGVHPPTIAQLCGCCTGSMRALAHRHNKQQAARYMPDNLLLFYIIDIFDTSVSYSCGPAATSAFPSSLLSYFLKFLTNLQQDPLLCLPLGSISICVARIKDSRINSRKFCRNFEVEVRDCLCRCIKDSSA